MLRSLLVASALLIAAPSLAHAKPCRDAHGKFSKCETMKPKKCRDAKGKFIKCEAPAAPTH